MEVHNQNILEAIQGKWQCVNAINQITEEALDVDFTLLISENLISRTGDSSQYWPSLCNFELVGSIKDGYFYREDGCFMQVKSCSERQLKIELSSKNEDGLLKVITFYFDKEMD